MPAETDLTWEAQRQRWQQRFEQRLQAQLTWAVEHLRRHRRPDYVRAHLGSLMVLLEAAHSRPALHPLALRLILLLHPWPMQWGYGLRWGQECDFAVQAAVRLGERSWQALFQAYQADTRLQAGDLDSALLLAQEALGLALDERVPRALAEAGGVLLQVLHALGRNEEIWHLLQTLEEAFQQIRCRDQEYELAWASFALQRTTFQRLQWQIPAALMLSSRVIRRLESLASAKAIPLLADAYRDRATLHWVEGHYPAAVQDLEQAIALYTQAGNTYAEASARGNLGLVYWSMSAFDAAEQALSQGIAQLREVNARWRLTVDIGNLGLVYLVRGQFAQAASYLEEQIRLAMQLDYHREYARAHGNRAILRLLQGNYAAAERDFEVEQAVLQNFSPEALGCHYVNRSWCYAGLGDMARARQMAEKARALNARLHSPVLQILVLRCLAAYEGGEIQAQLLTEALELAQKHQRRLDEAACLLSLSAVVAPARRTAYWQRGVDILRALGAEAWLEGASPEHPPRIVLLL